MVNLCLCLALLFSNLSYNNPQKTDSLLSEAKACLKKNTNKTVSLLQNIDTNNITNNQKLEIYTTYVNYYLKIENIDSARIFNKKRLEYAIKLNSLKDIVNAKNNMGELLCKQGEFKEGMQLLSESYQLSSKIKDRVVRANVLSNLAYVYYSYNNKNKSVELLCEALKIYSDQKDTINMSYMNNNIGILYKTMGHYNKSVEHLNQSFYLASKIADTLGVASACNNMGNIYHLLNNDKEAIKYLRKSLYFYKSINRDELSLYSNLGAVYKSMGIMDSSMYYLNYALSTAKVQNDNKKIISLLKEISEYYKDNNQWKEAYYYSNQYCNYKESTYEKELPEIIDRIKAESDLKNQKETIRLLNEKNNYQKLYLHQKNMAILALIATIVILILLGKNLYRRKKEENIRKRLMLEQKLFRSQMNPHFFFNSLSNIQAFLLNNNTRQAVKYIARFARLMRQTLENSVKNLITFENELDNLENYLALQQIRHNNCFDYQFNINQDIDIQTLLIPPMLLQPFVENSIEHGLRHLKNRKGKLTIDIFTKEKAIQVFIIDNGIGREQAEKINGQLRTDHTSYGIDITKERLMMLDSKSELNIIDLYDNQNNNCGTKVEIRIPLNTNYDIM